MRKRKIPNLRGIAFVAAKKRRAAAKKIVHVEGDVSDDFAAKMLAAIGKTVLKGRK